jgi:hypothetical protein
MAVWDFAKAVFSEFEDGVLKIGTRLLGAAKNDGTSDPSANTFLPAQPLGIIARPRDPDQNSDGTPGAGTDCLYCYDGDVGYCLPITDSRYLAKVPPLKKGGTAVYCATGAVMCFDGENGSILQLSPSKHATDDGKSQKNHALSFDHDGDSIQVRHALGMSISLTGGGKNSVVISNQSLPGKCAYFEANDDGLVLNGNSKCVGSLAVGHVDLAQATMLAPITQQWAAQIGLIVGKLGTAINTILPGTVDPSDLTLLASLTVQVTGALARSDLLTASPEAVDAAP